MRFGHIFIFWLILINLSLRNGSSATSIETLNSGSFIIDVGIIPQTVSNGLKPYGLVYTLMVTHNIPVKWVIEPTKMKDGVDFTYNGYDFKGGPFIIPAEYIDSTIASVIDYWQVTSGVQGIYTTSNITVPVYQTLTAYPRVLIDTLSLNQNIIMNYYMNAGIDSNVFSIGAPADLNSCHDTWVNPHGDPTWATHNYLYDFITVKKGFIWSQCHAVSNLEGCEDTLAPFLRLNYLTTNGLKCWKTTGTGAAYCGPSITETHPKNSLAPYTYNYPSDPVMQFMDTISGACANGSEKWFRPQSTSEWRTNSKRLVTTSNGTSPKEGVLMVYGFGYDDTTNGMVMYMGGHDFLLSGTIPEQVAAQRAFLNFMLLAGKSKALLFSSYTIPTSYMAGVSQQVSVSVSSGVPAYSYAWTSSIGGTFADSTAATTYYIPPVVLSVTTDVIRCIVTDACGRKNFISQIVTIYPAPLPVSLLSFTATPENDNVYLNWITASEINNDYFSVNRSLDGISFLEIGSVKGNGTTSILHNYNFVDKNPYSGISYYNLEQTDLNGDSEILKVVSVKFNPANSAEPQIIPNPFDDSFDVIFNSDEKGENLIQIFDVLSNLVYSEQIHVIEGINTYKFRNAVNFKAGLYILQLTNRQSSQIRTKIKCAAGLR
jgi:hypothetical protein